MPLSHAVLALLADGPSHGYELKTRFESAVGPQWGGLNIGHLYQILERLVRDGHVTRSHVAQSDRPDKTLYRLTEAGAGELREWAVAPWARSAGFRDELFLKLLAGARLGTETLAAFVSAQRQAYLSDLAGLTRLRREQDDPLVALLVDAAIAHTRADLQIVDGAEERLAASAARAGDVHAVRPGEQDGGPAGEDLRAGA
ncbi:PadR family transcriptional regulator [Planomonospora venezuelensis]|uniref:DNA-binding PadR family transcriptional regulator n=1 Tax=Planomonospora venezuelensis TaxID=1999 RepID=A0A841DAW9_PLAVE|nr:PadR family transcriptional regulator [Planomonospora venezuelensis]MBB5965867.1 DNA-binding PadR family transcriptional regulator [Planomonospora venezuelensis]GIN04061.1 PadR family transcriptional regulator [Planomonospora venezuelensis]